MTCTALSQALPTGVFVGKGYARGPLPDPSAPINQGLHLSVMVSQMAAAVIGGAQQESRLRIFPVANRPDFYGCQHPWNNEGGTKGGGVGCLQIGWL